MDVLRELGSEVDKSKQSRERISGQHLDGVYPAESNVIFSREGLGHRFLWRAGRRGRRSAWVPAVALAGAETCILAVLILAYRLILAPDSQLLFVCLSAALLMQCFFAAASLYPARGILPHEQLRRRTKGFAMAIVMTVLPFALLSQRFQDAALLVVVLLGGVIVQSVVRGFVRNGLRRAGLWSEPVDVIGEKQDRDAFCSYLSTNWQLGYKVANQGAAGQGQARTALVAGPFPDPDELAQLGSIYETLIIPADLTDRRCTGLTIKSLDGRIGLILSRPRRPRSLDRLPDILPAAMALFLAAPFMIAAAIAIYRCDPGPVVYKQTREGLNGRRFEILKLRTMYQDADARLEAVLDADPAVRREWETHYKLRKDPRILPIVGNFLRATSIDELPQLVNVLKGDMRIVGPRPFPLYHLAAMDHDFRIKRHSVMPGLTGLWQVTDRSVADVARQQCLDTYYVDNRSVWFDAHIFLQTIPAVLKGDGAC